MSPILRYHLQDATFLDVYTWYICKDGSGRLSSKDRTERKPPRKNDAISITGVTAFEATNERVVVDLDKVKDNDKSHIYAFLFFSFLTMYYHINIYLYDSTNKISHVTWTDE